ncbi:nitrilase-related carbon-nitrogen hydrolase [Sinomonas sp. ASV486]|uniref:nitrilase-related carbon-nitrogen hydrolase n=1 Tax=Sinomonas sp. ASV486 TaxID=3051170 RepID=UPI0027DDCFF7|nr:nitrilase-related carbon-nitrogen hydrolase [Sinomonas sp. ASV486]MDQ4489290.1 nitrilase-related carbon-nitrogen hydrolase [Sinomonas sp. ASV486]
MHEILALQPPVSWARTDAGSTDPANPRRDPLRVALVQHRWHEEPKATEAGLEDGIRRAAAHGARVVFLPELTLSRYPADTLPEDTPSAIAEDLESGPTLAFARRAAAAHGVCVHASLYRRGTPGDPLGYNTAILVAPTGELLAATDKLHIPVTEGYYEDKFFRPGPETGNPYPVHAPAELGGARLGLPTCWDEWFPELARVYSLAGAEILAYPTAIGSEPGHPDFDTEPLWRQVIVGNGIANGTFMVVPNRWGSEGLVTFYGSSFISDPYGRILARAPREGSAVLVADLDLEQRRDWLTLFPFLATRRPDTYAALNARVDPAHPLGSPEPASPSDWTRGETHDAGNAPSSHVPPIVGVARAAHAAQELEGASA